MTGRSKVALSAITATAALLLVLTACADPALPGQDVLAEMEPGTPQDEVLAQFPDGGLEETEDRRVTHGYRLQRYFAGGGTVEVVWIHHEGSAGQVEEPRQDLTPVIFRDEALDGWGWAHFDARSEEWSLSAPPGADAPS